MDLVQQVPRMQLAEVSRFCVSKSFKKRQGEPGTTAGVSAKNFNTYTEDERRVFPHITLALIACLIRMNYQHGLTHWYAVMETALIRFLSQIGIYFTPIGPIVDYHGKRQPCIIEVEYLLEGVKNKNPEIWELLTDHGTFGQSGKWSTPLNDLCREQVCA
jgi:N-acyl amino acid synthase of PEP-CTERM/exosortase system